MTRKKLTLAPDAVFVDGENLSRLDIASLSGRFNASEKKLYQTERAARKSGYPGFEHVIVPYIGKESVDKAIAMDIVMAWHQGAKRICIASNDYDYGATALHLKFRFPKMHITMVCDPARVSRQYIQSLRKQGILVESLSESCEIDAFAARILEVVYELGRRDTLSLAELGAELRARGIEYKKLSKTLAAHNVVDPRTIDAEKGLVKLSEDASREIQQRRNRDRSAG